MEVIVTLVRLVYHDISSIWLELEVAYVPNSLSCCPTSRLYSRQSAVGQGW